MPAKKMDRVCDVEGCGRKHAAHGLCLMHYKRQKKHGSPDYRWGGKFVGRACQHCQRPAISREMCWRHYQMWRNHGDPLFADKKKVGGFPAGEHFRRGYKMVGPSKDVPAAVLADASTVKSDAHATRQQVRNLGLRDGSGRSRRTWEHRKVAGAQPGQIVHHIDGDKLNNSAENLHVFSNPAEHGAAHRSLELIAYELLQSGRVVFDRETGLYALTQSGVQSK